MIEWWFDNVTAQLSRSKRREELTPILSLGTNQELQIVVHVLPKVGVGYYSEFYVLHLIVLHILNELHLPDFLLDDL